MVDTQQESGRSRLSRERTTVLVVLLAVLAFKAVYLVFYARQMPYFNFPLGDSAVYLDWASRIAHGDLWGRLEPFRVFYRAPLYPYLLAGPLSISQGALLPVYVGQMLLGLANLFLVYLITRRLFSHRAGLFALVLGALYAPLTFKESKLVSVTLVITCLLLAAYLLIQSSKVQEFQSSKVQEFKGSRAQEFKRPEVQELKGSRGRWLWAGVLLGLATIAWGGAIVVLPAVLVAWLLLKPRPGVKMPALLVAGWLVVLLPVMLHNVVVGRDFVLVNSNTGYTFYQGNNPAANGSIVHPPEVYEQTWNGRFPTGIVEQQGFDLGYASSRAGRQLRPSEASAFWLKRGLDFIVHHPGRFLRLEWEKLVLLLSSHEFAGNYFLGVEQEQVPVLRFLFVPFALLLALGVVGMIWARAAAPRWPLFVVMIATVLTMLAFYVGSRYRLPLVLPLAVFAGAAADRLLRRRPPLGELGLTAALVVVSGVLCTVPLNPRQEFVTALGYRNLGECWHVQARDPVRGEAAYDRGLAIFDAHGGFRHSPLTLNALGELHLLRGNARLDRADYDGAVADFRRARALDPRSAEPASQLTVAYYTRAMQPAVKEQQLPDRARLDTALACSRDWRQLDTGSIAARALAGDILLARGDSLAARDVWQEVVSRDTLHSAAWLALAELYAAAGDTGLAAESNRRVMRLDSFNLVAPLRLGLASGRQGRHQEARDIMRPVLARLDRNPPVRRNALQSAAAGHYIDLKFYVGIACLNLAAWDEAAQAAQEILQIVPDHRAAEQLRQAARDRIVPK